MRTIRMNPETIALPIGSYSHAVRVAGLVLEEALLEVDLVAVVPA
jgi:hypothetical protein